MQFNKDYFYSLKCNTEMKYIHPKYDFGQTFSLIDDSEEGLQSLASFDRKKLAKFCKFERVSWTKWENIFYLADDILIPYLQNITNHIFFCWCYSFIKMKKVLSKVGHGVNIWIPNSQVFFEKTVTFFELVWKNDKLYDSFASR